MHQQSLYISVRIAAVLLAAVLLTHLTASADILWVVGDSNPRVGRVVHWKDNGELLFKVRGEQKEYSEESFATDQIETLVVNVDVPRLQRLDPANLPQYRDYAEELAAQKLDREARELAIRLFLITATGADRQNDPALVESALAGLPELARNELEREAFARLRMLYARDLQTHPSPRYSKEQTPLASTDDRARQQLLQAIRMVRQEENETALKILNAPDVLAEMENWSELVSLGEIRAMTGSSRLSLSQLRRLLSLELALQDSANQPQRSNQTPSWSQQAQEPMRGWTQLPSFENVTEFDPEQSIFRNGQWIKPVVGNLDE